MSESSGFRAELELLPLQGDLSEPVPNSGVQDISAPFDGHDPFDDDGDPEGSVEVFVSGFQIEDCRNNPGALLQEEEQVPQSWIGALIGRIRTKISTPPPKPVEKEIVPFVEQNMASLLEIEERAVETFASIVENRELLQLNALAAGMSSEDLRSSDDPRFQSVLTDAWRSRLQQKRESVEKLRGDLEKKRAERLLRRR